MVSSDYFVVGPCYVCNCYRYDVRIPQVVRLDPLDEIGKARRTTQSSVSMEIHLRRGKTR